MSAFVVGVGSSGAFAERNVTEGVARMAAHPLLRLASRSDLHENPAMGGVTSARFVNAAVVVETALSPTALLQALHAIEAAVGRVRGEKNSARALDLDLLWGLDLVSPTTSPAVPHPHVLRRAFAVVPAVEAIARAGRPVPMPLLAAARGVSAESRLLPR